MGSPDADRAGSERVGGDALPVPLAAHPVGPLARGGRQGQGGVELGGADQPDDAVDLRGVVVDPQHGVLEVDGLDHLGQHRLGHPAVRERVAVGPARRDRWVKIGNATRPRFVPVVHVEGRYERRVVSRREDPHPRVEAEVLGGDPQVHQRRPRS